MRSLLFAPAHKPDLVHKVLSGSTGADEVIIDLEDGVPSDGRAAATTAMRQLDTPTSDGPSAICRIRAIGQGGREDLKLVGGRFDGVMIAKAESADDVRTVCSWASEKVWPVEIWLLIETARGLLRLDDMLAVAPVAGVMFGAGDMQADLRLGEDLRQLDAARSRIVFSCAAAGVLNIVDTPDAQLKPDAGFYESARSARGLGFTAKAAIHPAQLPAIHEIFGPTAVEIERATKVLSAPDGASHHGGSMVDEATKRWARAILASVSSSKETDNDT